MKKAFVLIVTLFTVASATCTPVWKCQEHGQTVFSDRPCPATGHEVDASLLRANTVQAETARARTQQAPGHERSRELPRHEITRDARNCPSEQDIRNLETKATSITLAREEKAFLLDEVRRARQCRKGQGSYADQDWRLLKEAQEDQSSLSNRQTARQRAEGVHSAADPVEGDRITMRRLQEEFLARQQEMRDAQRLRIDRCDSEGCWTPEGFYRSSENSTYVGPRGACYRIGSEMRC